MTPYVPDRASPDPRGDIIYNLASELLLTYHDLGWTAQAIATMLAGLGELWTVDDVVDHVRLFRPTNVN